MRQRKVVIDPKDDIVLRRNEVLRLLGFEPRQVLTPVRHGGVEGYMRSAVIEMVRNAVIVENSSSAARLIMAEPRSKQE